MSCTSSSLLSEVVGYLNRHDCAGDAPLTVKQASLDLTKCLSDRRLRRPHVRLEGMPAAAPLYVDSFSIAQIWEQMEAMNVTYLRYFQQMLPQLEKSLIEHTKRLKTFSFDSPSDEDDGDEQEDQDESEDYDIKKRKRINKDFFSYDDLQSFLKANQKENSDEGLSSSASDSDDVEEGLQIATGEDSNSEEEIRYEDFFGPKTTKKDENGVTDTSVVSDADTAEADIESESRVYRRSTIREGPLSSTSSVTEGEDLVAPDECVSSPSDDDAVSSLPARAKAIADYVASAEDTLMAPKDWTMSGEVSARQRPKNSLLDAAVELPSYRLPSGDMGDAGVSELACQGAAELNDETPSGISGAIERVIVNRIKHALFDDVERREDPQVKEKTSKNVDNIETLNFQKNRVGLAEMYASQYEQTIMGGESEAKEAELQSTIDLFAKIMYKLDCLSSLSLAPKPLPQSAVVANPVEGIPALHVEDPVPLTLAQPTSTSGKKASFTQESDISSATKKRKRKKGQRAVRLAKDQKDLIQRKSHEERMSRIRI